VTRDRPAVTTPAPRTISAKLRPPRLGRELLDRPDLVDRLREGRGRALTLVCAPAGYGKTTLLAQWEERDRAITPFVWVSLDDRDSDPVRLWKHVITGLRNAHPRAGESSLEALAAGPLAIPDEVLPALLDELGDVPAAVLVLDDWHAVRSRTCDETMAAFVERAPDALQVVVASRSDPGLRVALLRARGDLAEIRERQLRATPSEAEELLQRGNPALTRADAEQIAVRAEGWLAGLCLVRIALETQPDRARALVGSGTSRFVFDYLTRDVLEGVAPELRDFLLRSSVLDRLSAPACDAVLERDDSASMLRAAELAGLFLVALDEESREYRYHPLFAAVLRRELAATAPEAVAGLHARASRWYEAEGDAGAAIRHAIASRDVTRASELAMRHGQAYWSSGRVATVAGWLEALSWPEAEADPELALLRANVAGLTGRGRDEIERWLRVAEAAPDRGPLANGLASCSAAAGIILAAYLSRGIADAVGGALRALEQQSPGSPWRGPMLAMLGQGLYLAGRPDEARAPLEEMRTVVDLTAWAPGAALGLAYLALVALESHRPEDARRIAEEALELVDSRHLGSGIAAANPHLALGCALMATPDLRGAIAHLERAAELTAATSPGYWHAHALLRLADAQHRLGDDVRAGTMLEEVRRELDHLPDTGMLGTLLAETEALLHRRTRRDGFLGDELTEAERRVLDCLNRGLSLSQVARELWLSTNTVKSHRRNIYRKLGVHTREELIRHEHASRLGADEAG
jgi:LuxR family maltose regulon positive regulatory protein